MARISTRRKLTDEQIVYAICFRKRGHKLKDLASELDVTSGTLSKALTGHTYKDVPRPTKI